MKKSIILISLLAAVSVFASGCGAAGNKTAEKAPKISIDLIAGNWDYKVMDQDDPENFILKGNVEVTADGSYTYAPIEGDASKGNVRIEYEEFSDDTIFTMFNFYAEDDSFWIGTYYDENDKDTLWIGNGGEECLVRSGQY